MADTRRRNPVQLIANGGRRWRRVRFAASLMAMVMIMGIPGPARASAYTFSCRSFKSPLTGEVIANLCFESYSKQYGDPFDGVGYALYSTGSHYGAKKYMFLQVCDQNDFNCRIDGGYYKYYAGPLKKVASTGYCSVISVRISKLTNYSSWLVDYHGRPFVGAEC
jgi:hypothetical protein